MTHGLQRAMYLGGVVVALSWASACGGSDEPSSGEGGGGEPAQGEAGRGETSVGGEPSSTGGDSASQGGYGQAGQPEGTTGGAGGGASAGGAGASAGGAGASAGGEGGALARTHSLIDDFEDGDGAFAGVDSHFGRWFTGVDLYDQGQIEPWPFDVASQSCLNDSEGCAVVSGETPRGSVAQPAWARFYGVFTSPTGDAPKVYDAREYAGLAFWARGEARLRFEVMMASLLSQDRGGTCNPQVQSNCNNGHKLRIELTPEWQQYFVPFWELDQDTDGTPRVDFDPTELYGFFLWFEEGTTFSAAFDDFAFY